MKKINTKQLFQSLTLVLIFAALLFYSCKKDKSCEGCINGNRPPIAMAGPDQAITLPTDSIILDGFASNDSDGSIADWQWTKISGPSSFTIVNANASKTSVKNLVTGVYKFELVVKDNGGLSGRDTLQVTVNNASQPNRPPVANAGPDQTITLPANSVTIDGSGSTDQDNNISSYLWTKIAGPLPFTIINSNASQTQVTNLAEGVYLFELKVTDNGGLFSKDTVQIFVMSSVNPGSGKVYIAGCSINASGKSVARIWRDNVLQDLSNGQYDAEALSVFVAGIDVYVAGWEKNVSGKNVAKLWKNGVAQNLSSGQYDAVARSVFVSGTDVYVAGWEVVNTNGNSAAKLWKNGVAQNLSNGANYGMANSVFISGTDVYVAGWDNNGAVTLWKNGVAQVIYDWADTGPSLFVYGSDVYVAMGVCAAAGVYCDAVLWKNGVVQTLTANSAIATSVFVSGSNVYVAGQHPNGRIWKNGVAQNEQGIQNANSVYVSGNIVYAVGNDFNGSSYLWKNGIEYSIPGLRAANSVFVQ